MHRRTLNYLLKCKQFRSFQLVKREPLSAPLCYGEIHSHRCFSKSRKPESTSISSLFVPAPIQPSSQEESVGAELVGKISKPDVLRVLNNFYKMPEIKILSAENGLDNYLQHQAYLSFRKFCIESESLPADLHIVLSDILRGSGHTSDIFPYFLRHARQIFPHLECMDDLKKISDLTTPPSWYPMARSIKRKIIFHAGPTNSGKTYHALERFLTAESAVYCGPLKLLAAEVYKKSNDRGVPCDLVTGEERKYAKGEGNPSSHVACTVEMTNLNMQYDVAVIDEVQLVSDPSRGWAWTRAILGVPALEIHVCGEPAAIDLISAMALTCDEQVEVKTYERLTPLTIESAAVSSLDNVQPGDCIVCFSKNDIYTVSRGLESNKREVAVIYGGLPPGTKLMQAAKFNDPESSCKILVATDAIGMGINLSIKRVVFYSLIKPVTNEKGEKELDTISAPQALQIAGRAGRFNTQFDQGFVTTFKPEDLSTLQKLLSQAPEPITKSGLHPTAEQIELYAYHLPSATLSNLMTIFEGVCTVDDSLYFMCNMDDFKYLADMIQHIPLSLRTRYLFCCAPINRKMPFVCSMFVKFARLFSRNEAITFRWLCRNIGTPFGVPRTISDLLHLETVFDVLDLYLWLSFRFPDVFPAVSEVRDLQVQLDEVIQQGVSHITKLLENTSGSEFGSPKVESEIKMKRDHHGGRPPSSSTPRGRLTERLMAQGLLTPNMLKQLRREWNETSYESHTEGPSKTKKFNRKRKTHL